MIADSAIPLSAVCEWVDKVVTTDPPRDVPHTEWHLAIRLSGHGPMRSVVLLRTRTGTLWGLVDAQASSEIGLRAAFSPMSWADSDEVQVAFEWHHVVVTDRPMKMDARERVVVTLPATASTGMIVPVVRIPDQHVELEVLPLALEDTESRRHGRWRLKPAAVERLPEGFAPLASGHQHGIIPRR